LLKRISSKLSLNFFPSEFGPRRCPPRPQHSSASGLWQDDLARPGGHEAGEPVMIRNYGPNYIRFKLASDVSFLVSILIMLMLSKELFYRTIPRMRALKFIAFVDMCSLVFAYTAATNPRYILRGSIFNYMVAICICIFTYAGLLHLTSNPSVVCVLFFDRYD